MLFSVINPPLGAIGLIGTAQLFSFRSLEITPDGGLKINTYFVFINT